MIALGFRVCPTWQEVHEGARPEQVFEPEPGEWAHGWQYYAASQIERNYREYVVMPNMHNSDRALLRSQSGPGAGAHLVAIPFCPELTIEPHHFRTILLRRLRMPLPLTARHCNGRACRGHLDELGDHRAACPVSGRLKRRSVPMERMLARVCREGGARVRTNRRVRDLNVSGVPAWDNRRIEVVADGLPVCAGAQIALDATLVSPLSREGRPRLSSDTIDGAAVEDARRQKEEHTYRDIVSSGRCRFITCGMEIGGRFAPRFITFISRLAKAKARSAPRLLQTAARHWWKQRWISMLAVATHVSFAESLISDEMAPTACVDGETPALSEVLA